MNTNELRKTLAKLNDYENLTIKQLRRFEKEMSESDFFRVEDFFDSIENRAHKFFHFKDSEEFEPAVFYFTSLNRENFNGGVVEFTLSTEMTEIVEKVIEEEEKRFDSFLNSSVSIEVAMHLSIIQEYGYVRNLFIFPVKDGVMIYDDEEETFERYPQERVPTVIKKLLKEIGESELGIVSKELTEL